MRLMLFLETVDENLQLSVKLAPYKKPHFWPYFEEIWSLPFTHGVVILTKCHNIMTINVDILLVANFKPSRKFSSTVSSINSCNLTAFKICP